MERILQKMLRLTLFERLFKKERASLFLVVPLELDCLNDKKQFIIETTEFLERNINISK